MSNSTGQVKEAGEPERAATFRVAAPARVNLLGEHTDYTGGLVMPMAIPFETVATVSENLARTYRFRSHGFQGEREFPLDDTSAKTGEWSDYAVGVLRELQALGIEPPPFTLELNGDVPLGAGLSSSASVEVATCLALLAWSGRTLPAAEIALLCQRAENRYVGSPCGIMDQFVITAATLGHALLLHTRELTYELIPMNAGGLKDACVVVCNSQVKHSVATGEYGSRRQQMEAGQAVLCETFPHVRDLGTATLAELEQVKGEMAEDSYKRCKHVISENARVLAAKDAMLAGDVVRMGELMTLAHASQRDDLQTSCDEIDFLVDAAAGLTGCYGARMTGGGFGGCTVNLVKRAEAEAFCEALKRAYREQWEIEAETYICEAVDGVVARNSGVMEQAMRERA